MKFVLAILMLVGGLVLGLYVGGYLLFVLPIVDIIEQVKAVEVDAWVIAWALLKMCIAGVVGTLCASVLIVPSFAIFGDL
jgi:hypothetical protein